MSAARPVRTLVSADYPRRQPRSRPNVRRAARSDSRLRGLSTSPAAASPRRIRERAARRKGPARGLDAFGGGVRDGRHVRQRPESHGAGPHEHPRDRRRVERGRLGLLEHVAADGACEKTVSETPAPPTASAPRRAHLDHVPAAATTHRGDRASRRVPTDARPISADYPRRGRGGVYPRRRYPLTPLFSSARRPPRTSHVAAAASPRFIRGRSARRRYGAGAGGGPPRLARIMDTLGDASSSFIAASSAIMAIGGAAAACARTRVRENQAAIRVGVAAPPLSFRRDTITASPTRSDPHAVIRR